MIFIASLLYAAEQTNSNLLNNTTFGELVNTLEMDNIPSSESTISDDIQQSNNFPLQLLLIKSREASCGYSDSLRGVS